MKKMLSKAALAGVGMAFIATSAGAVGITVYKNKEMSSANIGPVYIANEALDVTNGLAANDVKDIGSGAAHTVGQMVIKTSVLNPSSIELSMTGGSLSVPEDAGHKYYLGVWDDANTDNIVDDGELTYVTDTAGIAPVEGSAVNGKVTFEPDDGAGLKGDGGADLAIGSKLFVVADSDTDNSNGVTHGLNFSIAAGNAHNATYEIKVVEALGTADESSATTTLAMGANRYQVCVATKADATIRLEADPPRTDFGTTITSDVIEFEFDDRNASPACTTGDTGMVNAFATGVPSGGGSVAHYSVAVEASSQAVKTVADGGVAATVAGGVFAVDAYANGGWALTADLAPVNFDQNIKYTFTVNGTDPIEPRVFNAKIVSKPESTDFLPLTYEAYLGRWSSSGYFAQIPYIPFGVNGYNAFIKIANTSELTAGDISVSGVCTEFTGGTAGATVTGGGVVKSSPAQSDLTVSMAEMAAAIGLGNGVYHCAVNLNVDVEDEKIKAAAFQSDPNGRTMLPLYPNGSKQ